MQIIVHEIDQKVYKNMCLKKVNANVKRLQLQFTSCVSFKSTSTTGFFPGEDVPGSLCWLPELLDLFLHAQAFLLEVDDPLPHVDIALGLPMLRVDGLRLGCAAGGLLKQKVGLGYMGVGGVLRVVVDEEPARDRSSKAELLEEEHLNDDPEGEPLVLRGVGAGFQGELLAVDEPAELLPLRLREARMRLKWEPKCEISNRGIDIAIGAK